MTPTAPLFGWMMGAVGEDGASDATLYRNMMSDADLGYALGYDAPWVVEHHFSNYYPTPSPMVVLSHIAAKYPDFGLGTAVIVTPWHHPLRIAEEIAMLSLLSEGPLRIGLGRGMAPLEYEAFGVSLFEAKDRFEEIREIIRLALSGRAFHLHRQAFQDRARDDPASDAAHGERLVLRRDQPAFERAEDRRSRPAADDDGTGAAWRSSARSSTLGSDATTQRGGDPDGAQGRLADPRDGRHRPRGDGAGAQIHSALVPAAGRALRRRREALRQCAHPMPRSRRRSSSGSPTATRTISVRLFEVSLIGSAETVRERLQRFLDVGYNYVMVQPSAARPAASHPTGLADAVRARRDAPFRRPTAALDGLRASRRIADAPRVSRGGACPTSSSRPMD